MSTRTLALLLATALVSVVGVLALTDGSGPTAEQQARSLAGELRCPTCDGESVAQSDAPMARSMRSEVAAQLRAGRSPSEIRDWFRARYGDDVVLTPGRDGLGWMLWWLPPAVLVAGIGMVLVRRRRSRADAAAGTRAGPGDPPARLGSRSLAATAVVVLSVGAAVPALAVRGGDDGQAPTAAAAVDPAVVAQRLDDAGRYDDAVAAWQRARRAHPGSDEIRTRLAFDLLRSGRSGRVPRLVRPLAGRPGPERGFALLVLGLARRDLHRPGADRTLRDFLRVDPDHPAAGEVRRLLAAG